MILKFQKLPSLHVCLWIMFASLSSNLQHTPRLDPGIFEKQIESEIEFLFEDVNSNLIISVFASEYIKLDEACCKKSVLFWTFCFSESKHKQQQMKVWLLKVGQRYKTRVHDSNRHWWISPEYWAICGWAKLKGLELQINSTWWNWFVLQVGALFVVLVYYQRDFCRLKARLVCCQE